MQLYHCAAEFSIRKGSEGHSYCCRANCRFTLMHFSLLMHIGLLYIVITFTRICVVSVSHTQIIWYGEVFVRWMRHLFSNFGRTLLCQRFLKVKVKVVSLSFLIWEHFLSYMTVFFSVLLISRARKGDASEGPAVYSCYNINNSGNFMAIPQQ